MLGDNKKITIDKRNKTLMPYTTEMKEELEREILSLDGVSSVKWSNANSTESSYIRFKVNGVKFKVRISSHTTATNRNEVLFPMYYSDRDRCWLIDANLGYFKPKDVAKSAKAVCKQLEKYDNDETIELLKDFADKKKIEPQDDEDIDDLSYDLATKYINEKKLKDDKFGTTFQVVRYISRFALGEILDEERYMADI